MNKRSIILDFTSLLDVVMIILFFFVLFSHFEAIDAKNEMQAAKDKADQLYEEAESMLDNANSLMAEAEEKNKLADEMLAEADSAGDRHGENVDSIVEFGRNLNIRIKLQMEKDSWRLDIYKGDSILSSVPKGEMREMVKNFSDILSGAGFSSEDTLLCIFVYDASEEGTAAAYKDISLMLYNLKDSYKHFFVSVVDNSVFSGGNSK